MRDDDMVLVEAELIAASLLDQEGEVVSLLSLPRGRLW
jgi:hypothetical protein